MKATRARNLFPTALACVLAFAITGALDTYIGSLSFTTNQLGVGINLSGNHRYFKV